MSKFNKKHSDEEEDFEDEEDDLEEEDEDDEEDEDYDEDDGNRNNKRKKHKNKRMQQLGPKKRKTGANRFVQEEASENDDEESDGGDDDDSLDPNERREAEKNALNLYARKAHVPEILKISEDDLQRRYANDNDENIEEEFELSVGEKDEISEQVHQRRYLPGDDDPKLFAVKCKENMERESVLMLINKFLYLDIHNNVDLKIFSASSIEKFPGYVYIESRSEVNVRNAIKDIPGLRFGENSKIKIIPKDEIPMVFTVDETKQIEKIVKKGQLVRIKKGLYTGDIAKVVDIYPDLFEVVVKLVPRLEKMTIEENKEDQGENKPKIRYSKKNLHQRPPKQLFNANNFHGGNLVAHRESSLTINDTDIDVSQNDRNYEYNGQVFLNGLLYMKTKMDYLEVKDVVPTLEEIEMFVQNEPNSNEKNRILEDAIEAIEQTKRNINKFQKGDQVRVVEGDLRNLRGTVINTIEKEVTIVPSIEDMKDLDIKNITFPVHQLVKDFKEGDHVKTQTGKTGTVIKIEDQTAIILLDNYKEEIRSFVNDLMRSTEVNTEKMKVNNLDLKRFDLVKLNGHDSAGMILKAEKDGAVIINDRGKVANVSMFNILSKVNNRNVNYQNNYKQILTIDSSVKVVDGLYKGKIATIKHIFKDVLFLFNQEIIQTSGIFVEKANNCYLINININNKEKISPYTINKQENAGAETKPALKGKDSWVGQQCIVRKGGWKGFEGVIKDADDKTVRIELSAKAKVITLTRDLICLKNGMYAQNDNDQSTKFDQVGKTPVHPGMRNITFNPASPFPGQSPAYMASPAWQFGN